MDPLLIFAIVAIAPILLAIIFGVNSVMLFLSVAVGALLQQSLTDSVSLVVSALTKESADTVAAIVLLCTPVVLTLFALRRSTKSSSLALQIAPLVLTGVTFAYLVMAQLGSGFQDSVYASQFGGSIKQSSDLVIAIAAGLNLFLAWRLYRNKHDAKHGKKHH